MDPCIPFFKIRTESAVRGPLHPLFYNSDEISGPRIPSFPLKIWTDSAACGSLQIVGYNPLFKIRIDSTVDP